MSLPLILPVFPVLCGALSLCVGLILSLELLHTFIPVHCLTLFLIHCGTLLPGGWLAQTLCLCILCVPDCGVLSNTLDCSLSPEGSSSRSGLNSSVLWSSTCKTE